MHEDHQLEQYFFAPPTLERLAAFVRTFERPLLLCCPRVGQHLWEHHRVVVPVLDVDERFATLPGFVRWDLYRPTALDLLRPDLILVDPPFLRVRPDQLFHALRTLVGGDLATTRLMIAMEPSRAPALLGTFAATGLRDTGHRPVYVTVPDTLGISFYSDLDDATLARF